MLGAVRPVAGHALDTGVVGFRVLTLDRRPPAQRGGEVGVAAQAKVAAAVDGELGGIAGMVLRRAVAALALDRGVQGGGNLVEFGGVAALAVLAPPVLDLDRLRGGEAGLIVPGVDVLAVVNAEVRRHDEASDDEEEQDQTEKHEEWPQYMHRLRCPLLLDTHARVAKRDLLSLTAL